MTVVALLDQSHRQNRRQVRLLAELRRLAAEDRVVVVLLHDLALAAQWADRIVVLDQGGHYSDGPRQRC